MKVVPYQTIDGNNLKFFTLLGNLGVGLGIRESIGHVDFYPNSGKDQPGCRSQNDDMNYSILQERGSFLYGWFVF